MVSLFVGELHANVTESMLYSKFSQAGIVKSIQVVRDNVTQRSLGYAYVSYYHAKDAEIANDTINYDLLMKRPIRVQQLEQHVPAHRQSAPTNKQCRNPTVGKRTITKSELMRLVQKTKIFQDTVLRSQNQARTTNSKYVVYEFKPCEVLQILWQSSEFMAKFLDQQQYTT